MRLTCPHCGGQALSAWGKLTLGPAAQRRCRRCGLAVGTAVLPALAAMLPCALVIVLMSTRLIRDVPLMVAACAVAIGLTALLYLVRVPLVPRELTRREVVDAVHRSSPTLPRD